MTIPGLMQTTPLTIRMIFDRMRTIHATSRVHAVDGDRTYAEVADRVLRLCRVLTEDLGVKPGDRVASFGFNTAAHLELYYAVPLVGAVLHTVNVRLHDDQIAYIIDHADDKVVFADPDVLALLAEVAPETPGINHHVVLGAAGAVPDGVAPDVFDQLHALDDLLDGVAPLAPDLLPDVDENAAAGLCYTSGTTGMPKGVLYSHRAQVLHAMSVDMAAVLGITERDVVFPVVPMFHAFAWGLPYAAPFVGADLVLHGSDSSPEHLADLIAQHRVTVTAGVPTIWKTLMPAVEAGTVDLSSLRLIGVGGSASPRSLIEFYDARGIEYLQIWGMTETGPIATVSRPRRGTGLDDPEAVLDHKEKTGTVTPGLELRLTDEDGQPVPHDGETKGEIEVRGPWIASAYYQADAPEKFNDGWLRTGDVAVVEPDGTYRIVDRAKDLVKSGGEWISSVELEGELLGHPKVADAAVVGLPHPRWDERPVAVVVPADPADPPTLAELHAFLDGRVATWWFPDAVALVEEIAKTSVGKLDKKVLRAQLAGQITLATGASAMQPKELFTVPVAGGELAVARWGGGATTVLALHGITANHVSWTHVAAALADDDVTLLAPDLRGRGDSGTLPEPYGYQAQVDDLVAVLDQLDLDQVVVLGHSGGAFIGTKLTRQHPDRVAALGLLDGGLALPVPADTDPDVLIEAILGPSLARLSITFDSRDDYHAYWRAHPALSEGWDEVVEAYLDHDIHEVDGGWVSKVSRAAVRADGYDALSDEDVHAGLAGIEVPVHFMWAPRGLMNGDPLYPREVAEGLLAAAPDVDATWLEDCNHYTASLSPGGAEQVADALRALLARP